MNALALVTTCAALAASGGTTMTGQQAPDFIVADWVVKPEVHLRNIRGRKALVFMYHTAC
ncbi:MAG: hypothetical protein ACYTFI_04675 [Planctomycetota bacterium]|jgi:hypothetical protein